MIKANELRVENLIYNIKNEFEKRQIIVSGITNTMIACKQIVTEHKFFEPIPLSEEWLLKAGFELVNKIGAIKRLRKNQLFQIRMIENEIFYEHKRLDFVHELQNLYFALTCEELVFLN